MKLRRLGACIFFFLVAGHFLSGQPESLINKTLIFDQLPQHLGLNQRAVNCIYQDKDGFLWVGSWSGLIKYDGYETKIYTHDGNDSTSIASHKITAIVEDKNGFLWIGTRIGGLFKFDKDAEKFYQFSHDPDDPNSLSNNNVWSIEVDQFNNIWVGTEYGLNYLETESETFNLYSTKNGLSDNFVRSLSLDQDNDLWACTENGVNRISIDQQNQLSVQQIFYEPEPNYDKLHNYTFKSESLIIDGEKIIFVATKKGLKIWDGSTYENFEFPNKPLSYSFFRTLKVIDGDNPFLLIGTEIGLSIFDVRKREFVNYYGIGNGRSNLSHSTIVSLYIDKADVLWAGTKKGLNRYDTFDKNFRLFKNEEFDPSRSILTGMTGDDDYLWISTLGAGIFRFDPENETFSKFNIANSGNDFADFIQKLSIDRKGHIWLGTAGIGAISFDPSSGRNRNGWIRDFKIYRNTPGGISDDYVMSMGPGKNGIWVGTWSGGLNKIMDDGTVIQYQTDQFLQAPIVEIFEDEQGILWIGSRGKGLYRVVFHENKVVKFEEFSASHDETSLSNNFITNIIKASSNQLWVGTEDGLNLFDTSNKTFQKFNKKDGLRSNEAISLKLDINGNLWIGHWEGLTVTRPTVKGLEVISHFDQDDRVQGGFFYNNNVHSDQDGTLYFPGSNGFNIINPRDLMLNPHIPRTAILNISIFDEVLKPKQEYDGNVVLSEPIHKTESITLNHDQNSIRINFTANHFAAPQKNQYAYKLEGFDADWQYTDANQRFCNYTNVPDGTYTFLLKASNNDGVWNEEPITLGIQILPPWWRTFYAFFGYAVLAFLMLLLFRRLIIMRTNYSNSLLFAEMEKENLEKHNRAKLEFFTNISHEFRTPLTLILGPLQNVIKHFEGEKYVRQQLGIIDKNTNRLLRLINQLLDFRKAESGKLNIQAAEGNFVKFVEEVKLAFDSLAAERKIDFQLHTSSNVINLWFDRDQFEKVLFNLLSNAFKHTPEKGNVTIKLIEKKSNVEIVVEDNGKGIEQKHLAKIFERFYTPDSGNYYNTGTGIGLALTRTLVEMHSGTILAESEADQFTRFIIDIPKGKDHFDAENIIPDFKDSEQIERYQDQIQDENYNTASELSTEKDVTELDRILIVEDNPDVSAFIKSIFIEEYAILEARNGEEGLRLAKEEIPDLVISDVMMPVMDGITLCKSLKNEIKTSHIPVILLTARTSLIYRAEGLENEADDYVTKPFNASILKLRVINLIKSRKKLQKLFSKNEPLNLEPSEVTITSSDEKFIQNALTSIEKNMSSSEYGVEDLGEDVGFSRMQLYRKLKAMTGMSANEFIRSIRLKRAAQLISQDELTIAEVTYQVGFSDLQYFRKSFKKQFGCNPSEYNQEETIEEEKEG
ncbi:MAG: response regulator [bacterium]|nr:response regulator [bacterium]